MISYKPLFVTLAKKSMTKSDLRTALHMGSGTIAKMAKNQYISLENIDKICLYLDCKVEDVIEVIPND